MAAPRASLSQRTKSTIPFIIAAFLGSWLAIAFIVGDGANFPISLESRRSASGLVALIPFLIAVLALFVSKSLRAINSAMPSAWLIAIQTYRVAGIMFVFPFLTDGILPAGFGWPAGIGDAITGIFAPVVALMVARNRPNAFKWAVAWNLFGTLDLIVAPATALYFEARVLSIPAQSGAALSRPACRNSDAHLFAPEFGRQHNGLKARRQRISAAQNGRPPPTVNRVVDALLIQILPAMIEYRHGSANGINDLF